MAKASLLVELSDRIAELLSSQSPHVVTVHGSRRFPATGTVWSSNLVVAAAHTVQRDEGVEVVLPDGRTVPAKVLGRNPGTDLALLQVDGAELAVPRWVDAGEKPGHLVLPLGRARGSVRGTLGMVAEVGGAWRTRRGGEIDRWIEVEGTLPRGFSGGPLVSADGGILGVNTGALVPGGTTLPTPTVRRVVERLQREGSTKPGFLGVSVQGVVLPAGVRELVGQEEALLVIGLAPGGPGEKGGLQLGDALVAVDGVPVADVGDLKAAIDDRGGVAAVFKVLRAGAVQEIAVELGTRSPPPPRRTGGWWGGCE